MPNLFAAPPRLPLIAPSILSADFARMAEECETVLPRPGHEKDPSVADLLHLDVMDGHFVPNLTMGPDLCRALRKAFPQVMLDVHLMVTNPEQCIGPFREAGADHVTIHIEPASPDYRAATGAGGGPGGRGFNPAKVAEKIRAAGMTAGLAINPPTDPTLILPYLPAFDLILVMSVNPGYSGQAFIESSLDTARMVKPGLRPNQRLEIDGGVSPANAARAREAGCDVLVAASAVFGRSPGERRQAIAALRSG